jgi:transcription elongation GreA/GreB family factor
MDDSSLKYRLHAHLMESLNEKIQEQEISILSARESRDRETKSSAGDKHETSRAMMQEEMSNQAKQLQKNLDMRDDLLRIEMDRSCEHVGFGNLVFTEAGIYFLSIGIGQVEMEKKTYFVISMASPIGKLLKDKKKGEEFIFQNRKLKIIEIS